MSLTKKHRVVDKELLSLIRSQPCLCCGRWQPRQIEAHHIVSRGAGGDDTESNVVPLCVNHHHEFHKIGIGRFAEKHPSFWMHLEKHDLMSLLRRSVFAQKTNTED